MKNSGCDVPGWMLASGSRDPKDRRKKRKDGKEDNPRREPIDTTRDAADLGAQNAKKRELQQKRNKRNKEKRKLPPRDGSLRRRSGRSGERRGARGGRAKPARNIARSRTASRASHNFTRKFAIRCWFWPNEDSGSSSARHSRRAVDRASGVAVMGCCLSKQTTDTSQNVARNASQREIAWKTTGIVGLRDARLTSLPAKIFSADVAPKCRNVDASNNKIASLPPSIGTLVNLQRLTLTANALTTLPDELAQCVNLRVLVLDRNAISRVPDCVLASLTKLQTLSLAHNKLAAMPSVASLAKLEKLTVAGNALTPRCRTARADARCSRSWTPAITPWTSSTRPSAPSRGSGCSTWSARASPPCPRGVQRVRLAGHHVPARVPGGRRRDRRDGWVR